MQLQTSIPLRRDGTVLVTGVDGEKIVFAPNEAGLVVGEVKNDATVAQLLSNPAFSKTDMADSVVVKVAKPAESGAEVVKAPKAPKAAKSAKAVKTAKPAEPGAEVVPAANVEDTSAQGDESKVSDGEVV